MLRLRGVDLNLLVVFQLLYELRNTGSVAEKLGVSQPAVSNSLARLRKQLGDELFERSATGLLPTAYADRIADVINIGLSTLDAGLGNLENFDPSASNRTFRVAMSEMLEAEVLPKLYHYFRHHAPGVCIQSVSDLSPALKHDLEEGDVDLAIGFFPQLEAGFYQRGLAEEPYVCLLRDGHPMLTGANTVARLAEYYHLIVEAKNSGHSHVEASLIKAGIDHTREMHVPNFVSAPFIVRDSDLIVTLPKGFAEAVAPALGLVVLEHPVDIEPSWLRVFWHKRYHRDPGLIWLRQVIVNLHSHNNLRVDLDEAILTASAVHKREAS